MDWFKGLLAALTIAIVGYWLRRQQRKAEKYDEQTEAVAALRFELQLNLLWLEGIFESRYYLRDEAWGALKNKGYISYLPAPIPLKVIKIYDKLYRLNETIRLLRDGSSSVDREGAQKDKADLKTGILDLIIEFDRKYPKIAKNFET